MNLFHEFLIILKKFGLEYYHRYYSMYPGVVRDNKDPQMRGRIKVELPTILGKGRIHSDFAEPHSFRITGLNHGEFFPPYIGDVVDVWFENGDLNYPVYKGGSYANKELPKDFQNNYPNVKGWVFKSGQKILIDETKDKMTMQILNGDTGGYLIFDDTKGKEGIFLSHKTGSQMQFSKEGNVTVVTPGGNTLFLNEKSGEVSLISSQGAVVSLKDKVTISDASGKNFISITDSTVELTSSGDVICTAKNINLKGGNIAIGSGASDNAVLYSKLKSIVDNIMVATALGPSGPPLPTATMAFAENIPPLSAKAGNVTLKGNI